VGEKKKVKCFQFLKKEPGTGGKKNNKSCRGKRREGEKEFFRGNNMAGTT